MKEYSYQCVGCCFCYSRFVRSNGSIYLCLYEDRHTHTLMWIYFVIRSNIASITMMNVDGKINNRKVESTFCFSFFSNRIRRKEVG